MISATSSMLSTPRTASATMSPPGQSPARFPSAPSWADDDDEFFDSCATPVASPASFNKAASPVSKAPQWQVMTPTDSKPPAQHFGSARGAAPAAQKPKASGWGMPNTVAPGAPAGSRFDSLAPASGLNTWRRR